MKKYKWILRILFYLVGLFFIALGINVSKMSSLGISPVSSIPRALEVIFGVTLGTTTWIIYIVLIILQIVVLRKDFKIINLFGILVTFIFSFLIDFTGLDMNAFGHILANFPRPNTYVMKLLYLIASLFLIGFGVFVYLSPVLVPMPAEGFSMALSTKLKKKFGDCKTCVDCTLILIALILQLIFLGGFKSFTSDVVVVREGTIISAIFVGQTVKLFSKLLKPTFEKILF